MRSTILHLARNLRPDKNPEICDPDLRRAITDAASTRNLHDRELFDAARQIMGAVPGFGLDPVRSAD